MRAMILEAPRSALRLVELQLPEDGANEALDRLRQGRLRGAIVLTP